MSNEYEDTLDVMNQMAMVKMAMNRHKGKIEDLSPDKIIKMMRSEMDELEEAISKGDVIINVIEEAADVMNFLVALVHQQVEKYRERKPVLVKMEDKK